MVQFLLLRLCGPAHQASTLKACLRWGRCTLLSLAGNPHGAFGGVHHRYIERLEASLDIYITVILTKHHGGPQQPKITGTQMPKSEDPALYRKYRNIGRFQFDIDQHR